MSHRFILRALFVLALAGLVVVPGAVSAGNGNGNAGKRPGFLTPPASGDPLDIAREYLGATKAERGLTGGDLNDLAVTNQYTDRYNGITHVYLRQRHRGIDVVDAQAGVHVAADGSILIANNTLVANLAAKANGNVPGLGTREAAASAARHLGLKTAEEAAAATGAKLVYQPTAEGAVRLAWELYAPQAEGDHSWIVRVDAATGEVLAQDDLVDHDTAGAVAGAIARPAAAGSASTGALSSLTTAATVDDGSSYRVFDMPKESPSDGDRTLVANPADATASPFGWHDTNGAAGAEFAVTRGNNVHAYADRDANNAPDAGGEPAGGAGLDFDFGLDLANRPLDSQPAYVTNLFFWNNILHDFSYRYGFTEAAGNFQVNNYGRGGLAGDYVRAEAQDGSGRNNANFSTPTEPPQPPPAPQPPAGQVPRMQMFEWRSSAPNPILVTTGALAGQTFFGPMAGFGESLVTTGPRTGEVVYVNDGVVGVPPPGSPPGTPSGTVNDGCEAFSVPAGSIPMMDRGFCNFTVKVKNAQNSGAVAAIVVNNVPAPPTAMGGADSTIVIPSVMISQANGATLKANVPFQATISDGTGGVPDRDSDIDNGVIAHEYGHGISNRLTGGPATACLGNAEQMGEGWSDWFALVLTTLPSDTATTARGIGTYVSFEPANGPGIRPTPYTTDMSVNPSTYASLTGGANQCEIWRGFAKRGLGTGASQGNSNDRTDGVQNFTVPATCGAVAAAFRPPIIQAPTLNAAVLNERDAGSSVPLKYSISGLAAGQTVTLDSERVDCETLVPSGGAATPIQTIGTTKQQGDTYHLNWQTDESWAGTCRRLTLRISGASSSVAYFRFT